MPEIFCGIHQEVKKTIDQGLILINDDEKQIISILARDWYITRIGKINLGRSEYKYVFLKPIAIIQEMFNLEREVIALFVPYSDFEPRSLDAFDEIHKQFQNLRLENICRILISKDLNIENRIRTLLKQNQESEVIVPFSYKSLLNDYNDFFFRNKLKQNFYSRDLFAYSSPLRKDLYFFGRTDLINGIVNRHYSCENSGLFGLRKSGKTSMIFGIERTLEKKDGCSIYIDCEDTAFHQRRWNHALHFIVTRLIHKYNITYRPRQEIEYTAENASIYFNEDINNIKKILNSTILIIFDEIENITFKKSPSHHWECDLDFIYFWQTIRSIFHNNDALFTFLIVGTNPSCIETPTIRGKDNPIFNILPVEYIKGFDVEQTREMVRRLGRIMGLTFEETIYSKLTEDYGGHPFLIRHACSHIHKIVSIERPVKIDRIIYERVKTEFDSKSVSYIEMLLEVLNTQYKDQYDMLQFLALGDNEIFNELANSSPQYINHLLGYGIITQSDAVYDFKIDAVKHFLQKKNKYKKIKLDNSEKLAEISERRNTMEPKLRKLIRNLIKIKYGESKAKEITMNVLGSPRKEKYNSKSLNDIYNANKCEIYFDDLKKIINKEWESFENIFSKDKNQFNVKMEFINNIGRSDAHAKEVADAEMSYFRLCMEWLEKTIADVSD